MDLPVLDPQVAGAALTGSTTLPPLPALPANLPAASNEIIVAKLQAAGYSTDEIAELQKNPAKLLAAFAKHSQPPVPAPSSSRSAKAAPQASPAPSGAAATGRASTGGRTTRGSAAAGASTPSGPQDPNVLYVSQEQVQAAVTDAAGQLKELLMRQAMKMTAEQRMASDAGDMVQVDPPNAEEQAIIAELEPRLIFLAKLISEAVTKPGTQIALSRELVQKWFSAKAWQPHQRALVYAASPGQSALQAAAQASSSSAAAAGAGAGAGSSSAGQAIQPVQHAIEAAAAVSVAAFAPIGAGDEEDGMMDGGSQS